MSRELDIAISKALGHEIVLTYQGELLASDGKNDSHWVLLRYSTDGNCMIVLNEIMREKGFELSLRYHPSIGYTAIYVGEIGGWGRSDSMIEAVALAAYKALTGKEWDEDNVRPDYTKFMNECLMGMSKIKDF